ncbi:MAG: hypothetical protein R3C15_07195 [Thermoleophilia bacterium]
MSSEPLSHNRIEQEVKGKTEFVRMAIERLIDGGYAAEERGPRNARLVRSLRPSASSISSSRWTALDLVPRPRPP